MLKSPESPLRRGPSRTENYEGEAAEHRNEVAPITGRYLETLFSSRDFRNTIAAMAQRVQRHKGWEFGFTVLKDAATDSVWFSRPVVGKSVNEVSFAAELEKMKKRIQKEWPEKKPYLLVNLHFHDEEPPDFLIIPSWGDADLGNARIDRVENGVATGYDIPPIEIIAARADRDELKLLVYQEPLAYRLAEHRTLAKELDETLESLRFAGGTTQQEVIDALRHYGYKAVVINTAKKQFTQQDLRELASFAFTPRPVVVDGEGQNAQELEADPPI